MNWIKAGIFSIIGGFAVGFLVSSALLATGDCAISAVAKAIAAGVPIGNVVGIGIYRRFHAGSLAMSDIAGGVLALIFSALAAFSGLYAMDAMGGLPGLFVALLGSCLGSLLGYAAGSGIIRRHEVRK